MQSSSAAGRQRRTIAPDRALARSDPSAAACRVGQPGGTFAAGSFGYRMRAHTRAARRSGAGLGGATFCVPPVSHARSCRRLRTVSMSAPACVSGDAV